MIPLVSAEPGLKRLSLASRFLDRRVTVDIFLPADPDASTSVLLINDGQDLEKMSLDTMMRSQTGAQQLSRLCCVGIHAGPDRRREYGTASAADYLGRGNKAAAYTRFILEELIPFLELQWTWMKQAEWAFAGFSLGGLSALDIGWHFPERFRTVAVFSGSLWWRSLDTADPAYRDEQHRLMHAAIRAGAFHPGQRFFFECGTEDEKSDRNNNGIIDSIDDTRDLIAELKRLGQEQVCYLEIAGGKHDVATWALAMPVFLNWAWGKTGSAALT